MSSFYWIWVTSRAQSSWSIPIMVLMKLWTKRSLYSMINLNRNERNPYISGCIWVRESFIVSFHSNWNSILVYLLVQIFWNHQSMSQTIPFIQKVKLWNEQKNYNLALPIFLMSSLFICHFKTNKAKNSRRVSS